MSFMYDRSCDGDNVRGYVWYVVCSKDLEDQYLRAILSH